MTYPQRSFNVGRVFVEPRAYACSQIVDCTGEKGQEHGLSIVEIAVERCTPRPGIGHELVDSDCRERALGKECLGRAQDRCSDPGPTGARLSPAPAALDRHDLHIDRVTECLSICLSICHSNMSQMEYEMPVIDCQGIDIGEVAVEGEGFADKIDEPRVREVERTIRGGQS